MRLVQIEYQVVCQGDEFNALKAQIRAREAPYNVAAEYRCTAIEDTGFIPASEPDMVVRIRYQYIGQHQV
jgi:hypothetical protein